MVGASVQKSQAETISSTFAKRSFPFRARGSDN